MQKKLKPNSTQSKFDPHGFFGKSTFTILALICGLAGLSHTSFVQAGAHYGGWRGGNGGSAGWNVGWRGGPAYGYGGGFRYGYGWGYPYAVAPVFVGAGFYGPPAYPYSAPVVYTPPEPMVMVSQPQPNIWYYCAPSKAYFPYVQTCATDWQVLPAMPPSGAHEVKPQ
ncbi:hypothetical protein LZG75_05790 [Polynucleobacter sp. IMCC30063]|uniref:hypothetical protein n=1 Tax=Polynucleobacter sp. IMCC30063 TaxID=2907298 RepID=UPI001F376F0F|nr:hypothetical protein [Polynucleobacter sp. IMCC30063]MCE7505752.1 hypothetical protein [Polynucleobacter sp. IMCC30063]